MQNDWSDSTPVKFGGLGFQTVGDLGAWLETHAVNDGYSCVYDHHTLMQAVYTMSIGEDLIKCLSKGYKSDIEDGHQAATIAAFKVSIPRLFCPFPVHSVVHKDQSLFTSIKSWNDWDLPHQELRE